jgi:FKBP-type peptidyl-prolyl cis-trans isomerase SlyD
MITDGHVVTFRFTLTTEAGEILDRSGPEPLVVLHGAHEVPPGLERALTGKKAGDKFDVLMPPQDGFGELLPDARVTAPRSEFPAGFELVPGTPIALEDDEGVPHPVWIVALDDDEVVLDKNHPLAGRTLRFCVDVVAVREATADEKSRAGAP